MAGTMNVLDLIQTTRTNQGKTVVGTISKRIDRNSYNVSVGNRTVRVFGNVSGLVPGDSVVMSYSNAGYQIVQKGSTITKNLQIVDIEG